MIVGGGDREREMLRIFDFARLTTVFWFHVDGDIQQLVPRGWIYNFPIECRRTDASPSSDKQRPKHPPPPPLPFHACFTKQNFHCLIMTSAESAQAAKQLDSVTDRVQETELDDVRAKEAMSALGGDNGDDSALKLSEMRVSKEDIAVVVEELEVTEDTAEATLKQVSLEMHQAGKSIDGSSVVLEEALRRLITAPP
jgi:hypothetical protein